MRFKADEIVSVLANEINQYESRLDIREVGRVLEVGDGIARVYGLSGVMAGEMLEFTKTKVRGRVLLFTTPMDRRHLYRKFGRPWNDYLNNSFYLVLVNKTVGYLAGDADEDVLASVGGD